MASSKTVSKGIRIKNEVAQYFSGKPLNRYIESLYEHIQDGSIEEKEDSVYVHTKEIDNVPQNSEKAEIGDVHTESEIEKRLKMYGAPFGLTGEELGNRLLDGMDSGQIMMEGSGFSAKSEYDIDRFVEACRMKGVDVEKMLEKCTQMIKGM